MNTTGVKIEQLNMHGEADLKQMNMDDKYKKIVDGSPLFVELNGEPVKYSDAYEDAISELQGILDGCSCYAEARDKILSLDNTLSMDKGYSSMEDTTGNYYGGMVKMFGNNKSETIYWDVRWY